MGVKIVRGLLEAIEHPEEAIRVSAIKGLKSLDDLYGSKSWMEKPVRELLRHFAENLKRGFKLILNYDMPYPDRSGIFYNLIFATNNTNAGKIMNDIINKMKREKRALPFDKSYEL